MYNIKKLYNQLWIFLSLVFHFALFEISHISRAYKIVYLIEFIFINLSSDIQDIQYNKNVLSIQNILQKLGILFCMNSA